MSYQATSVTARKINLDFAAGSTGNQLGPIRRIQELQSSARRREVYRGMGSRRNKGETGQKGYKRKWVKECKAGLVSKLVWLSPVPEHCSLIFSHEIISYLSSCIFALSLSCVPRFQVGQAQSWAGVDGRRHLFSSPHSFTWCCTLAMLNTFCKTNTSVSGQTPLISWDRG